MTAQSLDKVLTPHATNLDQSLDSLFDLLRINSISNDTAYKADCRNASELIVSAPVSYNKLTLPTQAE
ncbi:hypothetical protein C3731_22210, partial [Brucella oryzae]